MRKYDKQAGSKPSGGFIGGGGLDGGGSPALLLAGLCSDCVINERSLCWRVCGTEESQRPKHHKGEKNEVRLLPGSNIQPVSPFYCAGHEPTGPVGVVLSPNRRRKVMMVCEEVKPCDCQQNRMSTNLSLWLETLGFRFWSETLTVKTSLAFVPVVMLLFKKKIKINVTA